MGAGRNIKGITIEIGGDTTGLQKALSGVNGQIKNTESQLRDVNNLLKLDPSNTVLVTQKQELLKNAIGDTAEKLATLESAQKEVTEALEAGKIGQEQYMAFQREVESTKAALNKYETELSSLNTEQDRLATNTDRLNKLFQATDTTVDDYADVLGSRLVTAIKNGSATSDQLKMAIEKIGKSATDGKADIKQLTTALDTVDDGQAVQNLIQELNEAGDSVNQTSDQLDSMGKTLTGGVLMEAADQLSAVGDKITELGTKAADAFMETEDATTKASVYFGETGEAAEQTAKIIEDVYTEGVGESMGSVSDAVIMVKKNLKDLSDTDITHLTEQAITLDELYGIDMNETLRGVNALMTQFGMDAQEAMDHIVRGTQNGLDKTNELGDNLAEYSGKFAQAGYSAQEYFQLLQNGLDGGAYNLDKVNDAINEITTRLVDGTIEDAIGGYSERTQELFQSWQNGGATQKDVINSIVDDIAGCTNQQELLNLAATAFGTMAEDGSAKFITSLTTLGDTYNDVSGSAQNMFDQSTTESQNFEACIRELQQALVPLGEVLMSLASEILPPITSAISSLAHFFGKLPEPVQNFVIILGGLIAAFAALAPAIAAIVVIVKTLGAATLGPIIGIIAGVAAAITGIIAIVKNWGSITEWFGNLWKAVKDKCSAAWTEICSFFTETIPAAWDNLVGKFQGAGEWWSGIWQQVGDFFTGIWDGICSFFTETIPAAWQSVVSWFQGIPEWWSGIWQQVSDFFIGIWSNIMQNPVINSIVTMLTMMWQNAVTTLQGIWNGLCEIASGAWEMLKNIVLGPILLLIDLVTGNFTQMKTDAQNIWLNIQDAALSIWQGIKNVITSLVSGLVTQAVTFITGMKDILFNLWENMKTAATEKWENIKESVVNMARNLKESAAQTVSDLKDSMAESWQNMQASASEAWENLKSFVSDTAKNLKQSAIDAFHNMVSGVGDALGSLGSVVESGFQSAIEFITSLPSQAVEWGQDFIQGIVDGINSTIGWVTDAVSNVADRIRSFLHFSVPDEGPLTDYESWMPDFMQGLAKGIEKSKSIVTDAIAGVSQEMTIDANAAMIGQSGSESERTMTTIAALLSQYLPLMEEGKTLLWDTGQVAGVLAHDMNLKLGQIAVEEGYQ